MPMMDCLKNIDSIPLCMQSRDQWVVWRYEQRKGKRTKPPFQPNGNYAQTNKPETWCSFDQATSAEGFIGIGYVFADGDGLVGIDLDHCIVDGELSEWAVEILKLFPQDYAERSPSGDGLHIICRGRPIATGTKKWQDKLADGTEHEVGLEVYDYRSPRYFTVTGDVVQANDPSESQQGLEQLYDLYFCDGDELGPQPVEPSGRMKSADIEQVKRALSVIPADDYALWFRVGMALKAGGLSVELWDEWSKKSDKYDPDSCADKWETMNPTKIGIGTIFWLAKQHHKSTDQSESPDGDEEVHERKIDMPVILKLHDGSTIEVPRPPNDFFNLKNSGVWTNPTSEGSRPEHICAPCWVEGYNKDVHGTDCGTLLCWLTPDRHKRSIAFSNSRYHEGGSVLSMELERFGLSITVGQTARFLLYVQSCCRATKTTFTSVKSIGWIDSTSLAYVTPIAVLAQEDSNAP